MDARPPQTHTRSDPEAARRRYWNIVVPLLLIQAAQNEERRSRLAAARQLRGTDRNRERPGGGTRSKTMEA